VSLGKVYANDICRTSIEELVVTLLPKVLNQPVDSAMSSSTLTKTV